MYPPPLKPNSMLDALLGAPQGQFGVSQVYGGNMSGYYPTVDESPSNTCSGCSHCIEEQGALPAATNTWSARQAPQRLYEASLPLQTWPGLHSNSTAHSCTGHERMALQGFFSNHANRPMHPAQSNVDTAREWVDERNVAGSAPRTLLIFPMFVCLCGQQGIYSGC